MSEPTTCIHGVSLTEQCGWCIESYGSSRPVAAAEVVPNRAQEFYEAWVKTRDALEKLSAEHKKLKAAAAEVGEESPYLHAYSLGFQEAIERCAQVADRLMVPGVAEEIRALKDKP